MELLFSFERSKIFQEKDLVMKAKWTHLYPYRTQKLSTLTATIAGRAPVKIANRQVMDIALRCPFFILFCLE